MADGLARVTGPAGRVPGDQRSGRHQSADRRGRRARGALAGGRPGRRRRARARTRRTPSRTTTSSRMFRPVTKLAAPDHAARAHPRAAARGAARGHDRPARAGAGRDPARRPERASSLQAEPLAPDHYRVTHPLPPHPGGHPRGGAAAAAGRAAAAPRRRRRQPRGRRRPRRPAERAVRDSDDHRLWPERRGAERAPALRRPAGPRGRAGGGGGLPARRPAPGRRLAARRSSPRHFDDRYIRPETRDRPDRHREPRHRPLLPGGRRHPGRCARGVPGPARRARPRRRAGAVSRRGGRRRRRCARSARRGSPARRRSTRSRSSPSACTRSCGACCRPRRSSRSTPARRPPTATTACTSARPRPFSRRSTSAGSASRFPIALGAKLGRPAAPVLAIHGDGGYPHERPGAGDGGAPRHQRGDPRHEQQLLGLGEGLPAGSSTAGATSAATSATRATTPSRACSAPRATTSSTPDQVGDAVRAALACGKPAVVEIPIDPDEFPTPAAAVRRQGAAARA